MTHKLTKKQTHILFLLYRFRFLTRNHIQALLNHKDHHRINAWLKDLTEQNYLQRIYELQTFVGRMTSSWYSLLPTSAKVLKENPECDPATIKRIVRKKDYSTEFIQLHLVIADLYFWFRQVQKSEATLDFLTQNELVPYEFLPRPLPNAYVVHTEPHKRKKRYFIEVLDDSLPRFVIRRRLQRYFEYAESGDWEENTKHPFPKILVLCTSERVAKYVHKRVLMAQEESSEELRFFTTTIAQLRQAQESPGIWSEVVEPE